MKDEKTNAKQFPCIFYAKHMETGLAGYESETILVDGDNIKNMIPSFIGKPVYVNHQEVDLANLKETAHGYVVESFYNELDGWLWVKMILVDDVALQAVANGWSVSNAYVPTEWGEGGTHHNVPFDRKITNGEFTHLAIVSNPRYEEAKILTPDEFKIYQETKRRQLDELQNSKTEQKKGTTMFKLFKNTKQEVNAIDGETMIEIKNEKGEPQEIRVQDMVEALLNAKKNEDEAKKKEEEEKANMDTMVTVGEDQMSLGDLINKYTSMCNVKKNESEDEEDKDEDSEKENAKDAGNEGDSEKTNSKDDSEKVDHFEELKNAHTKFTPAASLDLGLNQMSRGKQRYGSAA